MASHPCPQCRADCEQSGELKIDGKPFPIYQCETCTLPWIVEGRTFPVAFTFAVRESGEWFDPARAGDPLLN